MRWDINGDGAIDQVPRPPIRPPTTPPFPTGTCQRQGLPCQRLHWLRTAQQRTTTTTQSPKRWNPRLDAHRLRRQPSASQAISKATATPSKTCYQPQHRYATKHCSAAPAPTAESLGVTTPPDDNSGRRQSRRNRRLLQPVATGDNVVGGLVGWRTPFPQDASVSATQTSVGW